MSRENKKRIDIKYKMQLQIMTRISTGTSSILKYKSCQLLMWNKISNKSNNIQKSLIQSVIGKKVVSSQFVLSSFAKEP